MGKVEEGQQLPESHVVTVTSERNPDAQIHCGCGCARIYRRVSFKCVLVLLLSVAGFLSAAFWLPPFFKLGDRDDLDLDSRLRGHDIVASFCLGKPVSLLKDNILQLEDDIFGELNAAIRVVVLYLEPVTGSNASKVVFAVDPDPDSSQISVATQSLVRGSFVYLVTHQQPLRLTTSLFGDAFSFEVLKFLGGITIIPQQNAFPLQKVQIYFNFTLNYSIEQIQASFYELTSQLKSGLRLSAYENLYIRLSNVKGSTVMPPTVVQSSVLLAVGNKPSMPRLKQLAQTIAGSHSRNLGLNNTIFGKVKQVRLSSILQTSLNGSDLAPSPSPLPQPPHHHHHHHHHSDDAHLAPKMSPSTLPHVGAPAPIGHSPAWRGVSPAPQDGSHAQGKNAPSPTYQAKPPCPYGKKRRFMGKAPEGSPISPAVSPASAPHYSTALPPAHNVHPPAPVPSSIAAPDPLPHVAIAHAQPPSKSKSDAKLSDSAPSASPLPFSSSARPVTILAWACLLSVALVLHL